MGTKLVHPIGSVTSCSAPNGVWNIIISLDFSSNVLSSYPTYKSNVALQDLPAKCSASLSVAGGTPKCFIVTVFKGSRLYMSRRLLLSFLMMQNQHEQYEEFEGSYMPACIFVRMILQTSSNIPGGIGIFFCTQGVCSIIGIVMGRKYSSLNAPLSVSSQAKPAFYSILKWCMSFLSSGHRNPSLCTLSICSFLSAMYLLVGVKLGGHSLRVGISFRGSPLIFCLILNLEGSPPITGLTFCTTSLYFLIANTSLTEPTGGRVYDGSISP